MQKINRHLVSALHVKLRQPSDRQSRTGLPHHLFDLILPSGTGVSCRLRWPVSATLAEASDESRSGTRLSPRRLEEAPYPGDVVQCGLTILSRSPSAVSEARIDRSNDVRAGCSRAVSIQRLEGSRPAADAGPMGIEWDGGAVSRCVELLPRGTEDKSGCC